MTTQNKVLESNQLSVQDLGSAVKDRVRKAMMDAIPDAALEGLIAKEFQSFFQDNKDEYNRKIIAPFSLLVRKEISDQLGLAISEKIRTEVQKLTHDYKTNQLIGDLVKEMAPAAMQGVMEGIASKCIQSLKMSTY